MLDTIGKTAHISLGADTKNWVVSALFVKVH